MPYDAPPGSQRSGSSSPPAQRSKSGKVRRRRSPRWALWCAVLGAIVMLGSGGSFVAMKTALSAATGSVTQKNLLGTAKKEREHVSIKGAKNILLVGIDTRPGAKATTGARSDSIVLMHIPAAHDEAYMVSLPRDSYVRIPKYNNGKQSYSGGEAKINAAFQFGSRGLAGDEALAHGFELLALTVKDLTGITPDAGAIIDFPGFKGVVDVLGKVCMYVDEETTSIHIGYTKDHRYQGPPYTINPDGRLGRKTPGIVPNVYRKGNHCFNSTEALDFVRQRDLLENNDGDYGRQRHQQQFIKAVLKAVVENGLGSPTKLPGLLKAVGKTMTVDDGGIPLEDWVFAMKGIKPENLVTFKTNNGKFHGKDIPGVGSAEILDETTLELLGHLKNDTVPAFIQAHPDWVTAS